LVKQLDRKLGYWSVVSISMGAMLGSEIFVLPEEESSSPQDPLDGGD